MTVDLNPETEARIAEAVQSGRFSTAAELVEHAVQRLLGERTEGEGHFHELRKRIEESGVPMLSDEEIEEEIRSRRGRWA